MRSTQERGRKSITTRDKTLMRKMRTTIRNMKRKLKITKRVRVEWHRE